MGQQESAPDFETLLDWVEGRLPAARAAEVSAQVAAGDDRVRATVAWIRSFHRTARDLPLYDPPPIVRQRLNQRFAAWAAARPGADPGHAGALRFEARMVFDSRRDLIGAGSRGVGAVEDAVHFAFSTPVADLLVDVEATGPGRVRISGHVLPLDDVGLAPVFEATAVAGERTVRDVDGDEAGRFALHDVPSDVAELRLSNGTVQLTAALDLVAPGECGDDGA